MGCQAFMRAIGSVSRVEWKLEIQLSGLLIAASDPRLTSRKQSPNYWKQIQKDCWDVRLARGWGVTSSATGDSWNLY